eukprot:14636362-Alexandrium_andersonii.AAC.1
MIPQRQLKRAPGLLHHFSVSAPPASSTRARPSSASTPNGFAASWAVAACRSGGRTSCWRSSSTGLPCIAAPRARLSGGPS